MSFSANNPLVTVDWLKNHAEDPRLIIMDCRWRLTDPQFGAQAYHKAHLPNAVYIDMAVDLSSPAMSYGGRHPLPKPQSFQESMERCGVNEFSHVIAYDDDGAGAARLWWLLQFYGHPHVSILDGGLNAWVAHGGALTADIAKRPRGQFDPRPDPQMVVDYETVITIKSALPVIDARAPERYAGISDPVDAILGHIPGAVNIPYAHVLRGPSQYQSETALATLFEPALASPNEPIVYCGSGVSACVNIVALRIMGRTPFLYAGSWSDWIAHSQSPIERVNR